MDLIYKVIRLLRLHIGVAVDEHTAVIRTLELLFCVGQLRVQILYYAELVRRHLNIAVLGYLVQEQEQIDEPYFIVMQIAADLLVIVV